jgi:hypothetical protein
MKTLKLRIRDKHADQLNRLSGSVNFVWNYVNDLSYKHLQKTGKFFSAYDLNDYTKGSGELLGLHSQTIQAINETGEWGANAVTEVTEFTNFYKAENYHQDYYALNGEQPYCRIMITPKLEKFKKRFGELAK